MPKLTRCERNAGAQFTRTFTLEKDEVVVWKFELGAGEVDFAVTFRGVGEGLDCSEGLTETQDVVEKSRYAIHCTPSHRTPHLGTLARWVNAC
jgi:hypothetical protein